MWNMLDSKISDRKKGQTGRRSYLNAFNMHGRLIRRGETHGLQIYETCSILRRVRNFDLFTTSFPFALSEGLPTKYPGYPPLYRNTFK